MKDNVSEGMALAHPAFVIGLDGGGTKTEVLLADTTGRILGQGMGGPCNANFVAEATAVDSVRTAVFAALGGRDPADVVQVAYGVPGTRVTGQCLKEVLQTATIVNAGEPLLVWRAGGMQEQGIVIIAGTGSVAWGRNRDGQTFMCGGWGMWLGDEGSGYDVGHQALVATARACDRRGIPTLLSAAICTRLNLADVRDLQQRVYSSPALTRAEVAGLYPLVTAAAAEGDVTARALLAHAGQQLAEHALTCIRELGLTGQPVTVVGSGGVLLNGQYVFDACQTSLQAMAPLATLQPCRLRPAAGGVLIALEALYGSVPVGAYENLLATGGSNHAV